MNLPITSRLKRVSIAKQTNPKAKVSGNIEGNSNEIIENISSSYEGEKMSDKDWAALPAAEKRRLNAAAGANKEGKIIKQKTKIVPGDGLDYSAVEKVKTEGTVLRPTTVRRLSRGVKKSGKDVRQSQNKLNATNRKLQKLKDAGITSGKKFDRLTSKFDENTSELESFKGIRDNASKGAKSGKGFGGSFVSGQRDVLLGEKGPEQQKVIARNEAKKKQNVAAQNRLTTAGQFKQSTGSINPEGDSSEIGFDYKRFTGDAGMGDAIRTANSPRALGDENTVKKPSISNMKEKSIAYKTLKGGQNKLPKQLQDAIKAAPGKMKSSFKMKGYGKNK